MKLGTVSVGANKESDIVVKEDSPVTRGYVRTVAHLVKVEEID